MEEKALDAHYDYEFKGIRLDPYRIMQVYNKITHPAHQHAFKKLLRAGESVKPLKQDIREVIMTLERWLGMIEEEEGVEKQVNFSQESLLDWITRDATKGGWTPSPDQVLTGTGGHVGTIPRGGGMRLGTELGGIAYCSDSTRNDPSKSDSSVLTTQDPEDNLDREIRNLEQEEKEKAGVWDIKELIKTLNSRIQEAEEPGAYYHADVSKIIKDIADFGSYALGNYEGLNLAESNLDLGATNRLKPVEDKAEIQDDSKLDPAEYGVTWNFSGGRVKPAEACIKQSIKTLEDAYDTPEVKDEEVAQVKGCFNTGARTFRAY